MIPGLKFEYALLCDDVRREDNGKLLLIGVYGGSVIVGTVPSTLGFGIVLFFHSTINQKAIIEMQFLLDDATRAKAKAEIMIAEGRNIMSFPPLLYNLPHLGNLKLQFRFSDNDEWQTALEAPIILNPTASEQPASRSPPAAPST